MTGSINWAGPVLGIGCRGGRRECHMLEGRRNSFLVFFFFLTLFRVCQVVFLEHVQPSHLKETDTYSSYELDSTK